tara:strand:+ start:27191 stop:27622 length:432 start_codon:yes stop_codon:yes gene_type:complete
MREFTSYSEWRAMAVDLGCPIKIDHNEKVDRRYAIIAGANGVVTIGIFDMSIMKGEMHPDRKAIAVRGLRVGDRCKAEHYMDNDDLMPIGYIIGKADRTASFTDVPVQNAFNVLHPRVEDCWICRRIDGGTPLTFRQRDVDPI